MHDRARAGSQQTLTPARRIHGAAYITYEFAFCTWRPCPIWYSPFGHRTITELSLPRAPPGSLTRKGLPKTWYPSQLTLPYLEIWEPALHTSSRFVHRLWTDRAFLYVWVFNHVLLDISPSWPDTFGHLLCTFRYQTCAFCPFA